ncbi:MAG: hypothetical protein WC869_00110 [Phycisphaerae bacterium]|jgi:hypothetical protein
MAVKKLTKKEAVENAATKALLDHVTDNYDTGPNKRGLRFGLPFPEASPKAWGFRAIKEGEGFSLLYDRQDNYPKPTEASEKDDKAFCKFLDNDVIPHLRRYSGWLYADDHRYYHFKFTYQGQTCWAIITPQRSFGYVYGVVFVEPPKGSVTIIGDGIAGEDARCCDGVDESENWQ